MRHVLKTLALASVGVLLASGAFSQTKKVAIANFGPHGSLEQVIAGFKSALADRGFVEGVDFIYAIPSSLLMPALPAIASTADRMKIPVLSSSPQGAQDHVVLGAMSVSWTKVGYQAGLRAADILSGKKPTELTNYKPTPEDHTAVISGKRLKQAGKTLPASLADCNCVVE